VQCSAGVDDDFGSGDWVPTALYFFVKIRSAVSGGVIGIWLRETLTSYVVGTNTFDDPPWLLGAKGEVDDVLALFGAREGTTIENDDLLRIAAPDIDGGEEQDFDDEVILHGGVFNQLRRKECVTDGVFAEDDSRKLFGEFASDSGLAGSGKPGHENKHEALSTELTQGAKEGEMAIMRWAIVCALILCTPLVALSQKSRSHSGSSSTSEGKLCGEPIKKVCNPGDKACLAGKAENSTNRNAWVTEDVRWIITNEERDAFKRLGNDEERGQFIEQFWSRRDPTPSTIRNEFREEHYRRMMYANEKFGGTLPGWNSDRGHVYVVLGPPDEITSGTKTFSNGTDTNLYAFETWHYSKLSGVEGPATFHFVDSCACGDFRLTMDGQDKVMDLLAPKNPTDPGPGAAPDKLQLFVGGIKGPEVRFKDLEEIISHHVKFNLLPFTVSSHYFRVTDGSDWVPITIHYSAKDLSWKADGNLRRATLRVFGRVTTLTQRIDQQFEDQIQLAESTGLNSVVAKTYTYRKPLVLSPGRYRLDVVAQDVNGDRAGTWSSSLIIPDLVDSTRMSPIVLTKAASDPVFGPDEQAINFSLTDPIHVYAEVYGLGIDENAKRSNTSVDYEVFNVSDPKKKAASVLHLEETGADLKQTSEQIKIDKDLSPGTWQRGTYDLVLRVRDNVAHQEFCAEAPFSVK
jgi:GWxTD domain-containing protein